MGEKNIYLDKADALQRVGENEALYRKLLLVFTQESYGQDFCAAIAANDKEAAYRAIHTLKGVAGNLSLMALFQVSSEITDQLRTGRMEQEMATKLHEVLAHTLEAIAQL